MMVSLQFERKKEKFFVWGLYKERGLEFYCISAYLCLFSSTAYEEHIVIMKLDDKWPVLEPYSPSCPRYATVERPCNLSNHELTDLNQRNTHFQEWFGKFDILSAMQVYLREADAATVAFLILTTIRKEVPILKDVARIIAKIVYNSYDDPVWKNAAPCII